MRTCKLSMQLPCLKVKHLVGGVVWLVIMLWTPYLGGISVHTWKMSSKILIANLSCTSESKG